MRLNRLINNILILGLLLPFLTGMPVKSIQVTGTTTNPEVEKPAAENALPSLRDFTEKVKNGRSDLPTGVFVPGEIALPIVQQPGTDAGYVSTKDETITQFRMASQYRTTGLLAHDYLAGSHFFNLKVGQDVALVYGDGSMRFYRIYEIQKYQALSPTSPYSNFVDLANNNKISAETLFYRTYGLGNVLIFQTCISTNQVSSWGRLFVMAQPMETMTLSVAQVIPLIEKIFTSANRTLTANR